MCGRATLFNYIDYTLCTASPRRTHLAGARKMLSFDAFAARASDIRVGGRMSDAGGAGTSASPSCLSRPPRPPPQRHPLDLPPDAPPLRAERGAPPPPTSPPPLLATLSETYDAYVNLARSGLWFDLNPSWDSTRACYYLRCEPHARPEARRRHPAAGGRMVDAAPGTASGREEEMGGGREPRGRTVTVPVAVGRATLTASRLAALVKLGDEWANETRRTGFGDGDAKEGDGSDEGRDEDEDEDEEMKRGSCREDGGEGGGDGKWRGGVDAPEVGVSLAMIDTDGTMTVVQLTSGLLEPEDVEQSADAGDAGGLGGGLTDQGRAGPDAMAALFSGSFGGEDGEVGGRGGVGGGGRGRGGGGGAGRADVENVDESDEDSAGERVSADEDELDVADAGPTPSAPRPR